MSSSETINKVLGSLRIKERYFILTFAVYDYSLNKYTSRVEHYKGIFMSKLDFEKFFSNELDSSGELIGIIELSKEDFEIFISEPKLKD
jgi:hypothetical protein